MMPTRLEILAKLTCEEAHAIANGQIINAIKAIRERLALSLAPAKALVDAARNVDGVASLPAHFAWELGLFYRDFSDQPCTCDCPRKLASITR